MKKYIDELLQLGSKKRELPLCVQKMGTVAKSQSLESPVKLVYGEFYNAAIEIKPFYKPVSKLFQMNSFPK